MLLKDILGFCMNDTWPRAYACYNSDLNIRMDSTSGGIFTSIAQHLMDEYGAIVYGAAFDTEFKVVHIRCTDSEGIKKLRGSKYPQSFLGNTFSLVREDLKKGNTVLFTGTPCQVAGLRAYLGTDYEKLYTLDFVCHGVASPLVWKDYLEGISDKYGEIKRIVFKYKLHGWKKWYFLIEAKNGELKRRGTMTPFMRSYLQYDNIRPSCYSCHFKGLDRKSDFTISDCWGLGENDKELNDNKGLSALLLNNEKSQGIFDEMKDSLKSKSYDAYELMKDNWTTFYSVKRGKKRDAFFQLVEKENGYAALRKKYTPGAKEWIIYYLKRITGADR